MPFRPAAVLVSLALACPVVLLTNPAAAAAAAAARPYDFNGDGYPELVVGAPSWAGSTGGGLVVLPGSRSGLVLHDQLITSATAGTADDPQADDAFGASFASADFDRDGYADLAVGRPRADPNGTGSDDGAVTVLYGSAKGLTGARSRELFGRAGYGYPIGFGSSLAAADLDGDGYPELAVGAPGLEQADDNGEVGAVDVFRGGAAGLSTSRPTELTGSALDDEYGNDEAFGSSLAVADLDQDGRTDLVVASRSTTYRPDGSGRAGSVNACYGTRGGPTGCTQLDRQDAYAGTRSLAVGNVSGTSRPEVVLGVPDDGARHDSGRVEILTLSGARGSTTSSHVELTQDSPGIRGTNAPEDYFGTAVALGDLDHDGFADLVVSAPGEKVGGHRAAGRVTVIYGGSSGYRHSGTRVYDQNTKAIPGKAERADYFGSAVTLIDHDADGHLDLAVGAEGENSNLGAVTTLRGSGDSFTTKKAKTSTLHSLGNPAHPHARLGAALGG